MDFFERQDNARRKTKLLVLYFAMAVLLIVAAINLVSAVIFAWPKEGTPELGDLWNWRVFLWSTVGTLAVIGAGSAFKIWELRSGGAAVATSLGGRPLNPDTRDPHEQKLRNVVEEMAIASGMPVPEIFVLDEEKGINAFAAGTSAQDAAIGVTRGAMELLDRDELQGVIAHEFSHILNGDMRLNLRLMGLVNGILLLALIGQTVLRATRGSTRSSGGGGKKGGAGAILLLALGLLVIGYIGVLFARLIKSAVSRQREFLADAAAVQFTRHPAGLAGALKKIGGLTHGSKLIAESAEEASHLFFGNGVRASWFSLFSTHPPLAQRIQALEPAFDGVFQKVGGLQDDRPAREAALSYTKKSAATVSALAGGAPGGGRPSVSARRILHQAGAPTPEHLHYAAQLRVSFPAELTAAMHEPFSAAALVYATILSGDESVRAAQLRLLAEGAEHGILAETQRLFAAVHALEARAKLPLVDLALPALRQFSRGQFENFKANLQALMTCDQAIDLFEFTLQKVVLRHLEPHFGAPSRQVIQFYAFRAVEKETALLLSVLAHIGTSSPEAKLGAFQNGAARLGAAHVALEFLPFERCDLAGIDAALDHLGQAVPQIKKNVLSACAHTVAADGQIQPQEAELLRAIADALDCPLPPFLATPQ